MIVRESLIPLFINPILEDKIGEYSFMDDFTGEFLYGDVYKNPENLKFFNSKVRGISDLKGNIYIINNSKFIHKRLLDFLNRKGIVTNAKWNKINYCYDNIITWQRKDNENIMLLGESYDLSVIKDVPFFNEMFEKVKIKNPNINFVLEPFKSL